MCACVPDGGVEGTHALMRAHAHRDVRAICGCRVCVRDMTVVGGVDVLRACVHALMWLGPLTVRDRISGTVPERDYDYDLR